MYSLLVILGIIFSIYELYINLKKEEVQKTTKPKQKVFVDVVDEISSEANVVRKSKVTKVKKNNRVIVDREAEIIANSNIIEKDKLVQDIIFAEILSKPRSKK